MESFLKCFLSALISIYIYTLVHKEPITPQPGFIYQQELKEDGTYELITYPSHTYEITRRDEWPDNTDSSYLQTQAEP